MKELKDGLYIGLQEEEYHALPALSKSGIDNIEVSPLHFWHNSRLNPNYVQKDKTPAMKLGTLRHKYLLERDDFFNCYAKALNPSDYPNALVGADDLKNFMREAGIKVLSGSKSELIKAIREAGHIVEIWDDLVASYGAANVGKEFVSLENMRILEESAEMVEDTPDAKELLQGGLPEVSFIWTDKQSGVQLRARVDYLKLGNIIDLKTFSNSQGFPVDKAVSRSIQSCNYHMQALMYNVGFGAMQELYKTEGKSCIYIAGAFDYYPEAELAEKILQGAAPKFTFLFQATDAPYDIRIKDFRRVPNKDGATDNVYWLKARDHLRAGVDTYKRYSDHYGVQKWKSLDPIRSDIEDIELPWLMFE